LIEKSCQLAKARGLVRTNPVDGEEEVARNVVNFNKYFGQAEVEDPKASSSALWLSQL